MDDPLLSYKFQGCDALQADLDKTIGERDALEQRREALFGSVWGVW